MIQRSQFEQLRVLKDDFEIIIHFVALQFQEYIKQFFIYKTFLPFKTQ